jgi:release factor glutamine methyltransferase
MEADPDQVYPVREDTLFLRDAALAEVKPSDRVLELGTGSGFVARHLIGKAALVVATDINPHACRAASSPGVGIVRADLAAGIQGQFDLVLFNPPYLPTAPQERLDDWLERALDGGESGREVIGRLLPDLLRILAPEGRMLMVISELTGEREVRDLFGRAGFSAEICRRKGVEGEELMVLRAWRPSEDPARDGTPGRRGAP